MNSIQNIARNYLIFIPIVTSYYLFDKHVLSISNADGASMEPTIKSGDILIIDRCFYRLFGLKKDDIIVATQPVDPEVSICKRIVEVGGGKIPYTAGLTVPEKYFWIEGDNKSKSFDSRHHGFIPQNLISGRVIKVISIGQ